MQSPNFYLITPTYWIVFFFNLASKDIVILDFFLTDPEQQKKTQFAIDFDT